MLVVSAAGAASAGTPTAAGVADSPPAARQVAYEQWADGDALRRVSVDTLQPQGRSRLNAWELRVTLYRQARLAVSPWLRGVGSMVSALPDTGDAATSRPGSARGIVLDVPRNNTASSRRGCASVLSG